MTLLKGHPKSDLQLALEQWVAARGDRFAVKRDRRGDWIWRVLAKNGRQVGGSTEGYRSRSMCLANALRMLTWYAS
jgi:uncharacterized protein YegP (UPF0339 family)